MEKDICITLQAKSFSLKFKIKIKTQPTILIYVNIVWKLMNLKWFKREAIHIELH